MAILKKIRAATLVETLIASVIIIVVFMIASMSLNTVFKGVVKANDTLLENRIKELKYITNNKKISYPFLEETKDWEISIEKQGGEIVLITENKKTYKTKQMIIGYED